MPATADKLGKRRHIARSLLPNLVRRKAGLLDSVMLALCGFSKSGGSYATVYLYAGRGASAHGSRARLRCWIFVPVVASVALYGVLYVCSVLAVGEDLRPVVNRLYIKPM